MNYLQKTDSKTAIYGNDEEVRFTKHFKVEVTQKSANPSISVYGNDTKKMVAEMMEAYDMITKEYNARGKAVGPISS